MARSILTMNVKVMMSQDCDSSSDYVIQNESKIDIVTVENEIGIGNAEVDYDFIIISQLNPTLKILQFKTVSTI